MADLDPSKVSIFTRRGIYYMTRSVNGVRIRKTLQTSDPDIARARAEVYFKTYLATLAINVDGPKPYTAEQWVDIVMNAQPDKSSWLFRMFLNAKHRGRNRRIQCSLTFEQVRKIALRSAGFCELTGTPLVIGMKGAGMAPFTPSLDRRDSSKGYHWSNCRIVCLAANLAMSKWGEHAFLVILRNYAQTLGKT